MNKGMLLNENNDLQVRNGSLVVGESMIQDAYLVLSINQGELKEDPLAGINLVSMMRGRVQKEKMRKSVEIALGRIGISFDDVKNQFEAFINGNQL